MASPFFNIFHSMPFICTICLSLILFFLVQEPIPSLAEELEVLESQLNANSITGVLQNPYNFTVGGIMVRAEFYDKEDGHLVGLRNFYEVTKDELKPNETSTFKIFEHAGETKEFPKTDFVVRAEGMDNTGFVKYSLEEMIGKIKNLGKTLKEIPKEIHVNITAQQAPGLALNVTAMNSTGK